MEVRVGAKQLSGKQVEDLHLTIPFNKSVTAVNYTATRECHHVCEIVWKY